MRHAIVLLSLLLVAALAGCVNDVPDIPDEVPDRQTSLEVVTEPGAAVYVDDDMRGTVNESGALIITGVQPGGHELRVEHPEHFPVTRAVSLREFRRNTETVDLVPRDGTAEFVSVQLFHYVAGFDSIEPTAKLIGENGEYSCDPEDFEGPEDVPVNVLSPYYENRDMIYGYDYSCEIPQVPYGNYTLRVEASEYHTYEEPFVVNQTFPRPWAHVRLGHANPTLGTDLPEGQCILRGERGVRCEQVEVSSLGTFNFASEQREYYLVNATVTAFKDVPIQLLRPLLATETWSAGRSWIVSDEIGPDETESFLSVIGYPLDVVDEIETSEDLALSLIVEDRDNFRQHYATIGFKNGPIEAIGDTQIDRCERRIGDEVLQYGYSTLGECLRSFSWSSISSQAVRDFCAERPAFVGNMELIAGNMTLQGRIVCEDVPDRTVGSCYTDEGTVAFACEAVDSDLLENTGVRTIDITIANRLSSDVFVGNASVAVRVDSFEYEPCAEIGINEWFVQGERDLISFDFPSCEGDDPNAPYSVTLDLLSGGEEQTVSYVVRPPRE